LSVVLWLQLLIYLFGIFDLQLLKPCWTPVYNQVVLD
jgi:hypothetical protein